MPPEAGATMDPRALSQALLELMIQHTKNYPCINAPPNPLVALLGGVTLIDPSRDERLSVAGVPVVTTCIERISSLGYIGTASPLLTGWIGFAPNQTFYDLAASTSPDLLITQVLDAAFPSAVPIPDHVTIAVATLRGDVARHGSWLDQALLDELLLELKTVAEARCRNATIGLCGKLVEFVMASLLQRWNIAIEADPTIDSLIGALRGRAKAQNANTAQREIAQSILEARAAVDMGIPEISHFIRLHRNGAVHAPRVLDATKPVMRPSQEQTDGLVLFTVDLLRRYAIPQPPEPTR
jgi:hypothetical protein